MDDYAKSVPSYFVSLFAATSPDDEQIPGIVPRDPWTSDVLSIDVKLNVVRQVAQHFRELFSLRFAKAGSIYFASEAYSRSSNAITQGSVPEFKIGPIVSDPFFRSSRGELHYPSTDLHFPRSPSFATLHALRGPFTHTGEFIAHEIRANLFKCEAFPQETLEMLDAAAHTSVAAETHLSDDRQDRQSEVLTNNYRVSGQEDNSQESRQEVLERARRTMKKAIKLCDIYPGDAPVWDGDVSTPDRPFTLHWHDFRLANILVGLKMLYFISDPYTDNGFRSTKRPGQSMDTLILNVQLLRRSGLQPTLSTGFPIL